MKILNYIGLLIICRCNEEKDNSENYIELCSSNKECNIVIFVLCSILIILLIVCYFKQCRQIKPVVSIKNNNKVKKSESEKIEKECKEEKRILKKESKETKKVINKLNKINKKIDSKENEVEKRFTKLENEYDKIKSKSSNISKRKSKNNKPNSDRKFKQKIENNKNKYFNYFNKLVKQVNDLNIDTITNQQCLGIKNTQSTKVDIKELNENVKKIKNVIEERQNSLNNRQKELQNEAKIINETKRSKDQFYKLLKDYNKKIISFRKSINNTLNQDEINKMIIEIYQIELKSIQNELSVLMNQKIVETSKYYDEINNNIEFLQSILEIAKQH